MSSICILGRQPELGVSELESLFGSENIRVVDEAVVELSLDVAEIPYKRLGGSTKLAKVVDTLPTTNWSKIEKYCIDTLPGYAESLPEGKFTVGISVYGVPVHKDQLNRTLLKIKKNVRSSGRSVRIVPNNEGPELSSAQVLHNQLTKENGLEIIVAKDGESTLIAHTVESQDIYAYKERDQARPNRDAKVGMLPPKLAQIIINLANGKITESLSNDTQTVLDPFCGTGVILQEAALMGSDVYGTDLEARMVEYSANNLKWLREKYPLTSHSYVRIEIGDATSMTWQPIMTSVAGETYLGRPFSAEPTKEILEQVMFDVNSIHRKFFKNIASQLKPGTRLCLGVPAWFTKNGVKRLHVLDQLEEIGYNHVRFEHVSSPLIYHREGQFVGRELVVLEKR